jgi:hypothetical protein
VRKRNKHKHEVDTEYAPLLKPFNDSRGATVTVSEQERFELVAS